jgi:DnaJ-domain-containing protein 1
MVQEFARKEQAKAQREWSRRDERQRQEKQRQEDSTRKRSEQSQRRSRSSKPWWEVLGVRVDANESEVRQAYRSLVKSYHPDNRVTGDPVRMAEINAARDEALKRFRKAD